jgi:threonine/homoserine/homoserine lactone efflux protein
VVSRAGRSSIGSRVRKGLDRVTGTVMIGLGVRLALERR